MGSFAKHMILCHTTTTGHRTTNPPRYIVRSSSSSSGEEENPTTTNTGRRRTVISTLLAAGAATVVGAERSRAQSWGTRSFIKEKYFQPEITAEEAVERIRQTAEGMRDMRHMLDTMSWRYVLYYVRLKSAYLESDLKNAMTTLPESRRKSYVQTANEVVDNMAELDYYVRTPKIYESYLYYEKALKSLDDLVALLPA